MDIKDLSSLGLPRKIERKQAEDLQPRKTKQKAEPEKTKSIEKSDSVEISEEAKKLQKSDKDLQGAKELLAKLPNERAQIIYNALAKLKAGLYSEEHIIEEAASRLVDSGALHDLLSGDSDIEI